MNEQLYRVAWQSEDGAFGTFEEKLTRKEVEKKVRWYKKHMPGFYWPAPVLPLLDKHLPVNARFVGGPSDGLCMLIPYRMQIIEVPSDKEARYISMTPVETYRLEEIEEDGTCVYYVVERIKE